MLKITYETKPFYTEHSLNDPSTTKLEVVFDPDCTYTELIAKFMDILNFMTYSKPTRTGWEHMTEELIWDGKIEDDIEKEEKENGD